MKRFLGIILFLGHTFSLSANDGVGDSVIYVEPVQVTSIKQGSNIGQEPIAVSIIGALLAEEQRVDAISDLGAMVPNLYMPDYGSRITSSIYVRGIGARIDQPAVGLNIDNVPYLNKNAFDTDVMDISRMELLRGPQSTLYGRNTMGGVINIYTLSPVEFEGIKVGVEYGNGDSYRVRGSIYSRVSDIFALSASAYYNSVGGFFKNEYTGEMCDTEQDWGARLRMIHYPSSMTTIDNTLSLSMLEQGGYPYHSWDSGVISYNDTCSYDRMMLSNGLTISHKRDNFTISSITGYQYLDDAMRLDQDFSADQIFTLKQAIKEHIVTEDIVLRRSGNSPYKYLFGAFGFMRDQRMDAPVTFYEAGIESLIEANLPSYEWGEDSFLLSSNINTQTYGAALYHESTYKSDRWRFTAGLRLDYECATLDYNSNVSTSAIYINTGREYPVDILLKDKLSQSFFELLPKVSAQYMIDSRNSIYATASRGYKAGGYNTQMFSDILQQELTSYFGTDKVYTAEEIISYDPEYSWNYEIGGHFANKNRTLSLDIALFYIDCKDQQLTVFPEGVVTGRMMTNAGKSRSYGAEFSGFARLGNFTINTSYGYTNAKFIEYEYDKTTDYSGNYVPYAPQNTLYGSIKYDIPIRAKFAESISFESNVNGAGRIYWREDNTLSQPLYALLGASVSISNPKYRVSLWGRNLTNKKYNTFYFESMDKEYGQQGRPLTFGATLNLTINKN